MEHKLAAAIPETELLFLMSLAMEAVERAEAGELIIGDTLLREGQRRARRLAEEGLSWGGELTRRYRDARALYTASFGVPLE
jgi:hypothetical protein